MWRNKIYGAGVLRYSLITVYDPYCVLIGFSGKLSLDWSWNLRLRLRLCCSRTLILDLTLTLTLRMGRTRY